MRVEETEDHQFANEEGISAQDAERVKNMARFAAKAPARHPVLTGALLAVFTVAAIVTAMVTARTYRAESALVIQKDFLTPALGNQNRNQPPPDPDAATHGIVETVMSRDNLISLVKQAHLIEKTNWHKSTVQGWTDSLFGSSSPQLSDEMRTQIVVKNLERRLQVVVVSSTVMFSAQWDDAQTAFELVSLAQKSFLDRRNAAEVEVVSDAIALLEEHAKTERDAVDAAMAEFLKLKEGWKSGGSRVATAGAPMTVRPGAAAAALDPEVTRALEEKRRQLREMEDNRARQLAEMKAQLAGLLSVYTPAHPSVVALQKRLEASREEPPDLVALRNDERKLLDKVASAGERTESTRVGVGVAGGNLVARPSAAEPLSANSLQLADPPSAIALSKLQNRIRSYEETIDKLDSAKLELSIARTAFKYRYTVFQPPELPDRPYKSPVRFALIVFGLGLVFSAGVPAAIDLSRGEFMEPWQVSERLALPVLGEVHWPLVRSTSERGSD